MTKLSTKGSNILERANYFFEHGVTPLVKAKYNHYALDFKEVLDYSFDGGKRLRPYSTYLSYKICGGHDDSVVCNAAAAMELMHCSSLVFDDALDKSEVRVDRKLLTVRQKYSHEESMLAICLDLLYSFDFLVGLPENGELTKAQKDMIIDLFVRSVSEGGVGEINKWRYMRKRKIPTIDEYWNVFLRSSGGLFFKMSCETGAILATSDKNDINTFSTLGYTIGRLLQAGDDLKDIKVDMIEGFYSLAVIIHYNLLKAKDKKLFASKLSEALSPKDTDELFEDMKESGALSAAAKQLELEGVKILNILEGYPDSPEKKELTDVIEYLAQRMSEQWNL